MSFRTFNSWLFDGRKDTPIPKPTYDKEGKVVTPDILKYNSPITHTFVISLFIKHGPLNEYLNEYFNNINLRYLSKEDLFKFIKKCVIDFKIKKQDTMFYRRKAKVIVYEKLRERLPALKNNDISLLCDIIETHPEKESIYESLGLEKTIKKKIKKQKNTKSEKISLSKLIEEHFSTIKIS